MTFPECFVTFDEIEDSLVLTEAELLFCTENDTITPSEENTHEHPESFLHPAR